MSPIVSPTDEMLQRFGISALRPTQRAAFDAIAAARDVLVILPTGGGKSLCYQLPAACGLAPAIVVSPLVALMKDQVDALRRRGLRAAQLSGAVSQRERDNAWRALDDRAIDLLYLAPEALASPRTRARLARAAPRLLAIDEAHCISEWGESFRPAYLGLGAVRDALGSPPTVALTATATPRTARDIVARLALRDPLTLSGGFDRANLRLRVQRVQNDGERLTSLLELARHARGPAVMYASTRRGTERLAAAIARRGVRAAAFHAGLPSSERALLQDRFQSNEIDIIVATNAFGMGVDKPDVRLVAHAEPPLTLEAYYQEAGRGGRDGGIADCVVHLAPNDLGRARERIAASRVSASLVAQVVSALGNVRVMERIRGGEREAVTLLSRAVDAPGRDVATVLRLLSEARALAPGGTDGTLRLIASSARLEGDASLDPKDVVAIRALAAARPSVQGGAMVLSLRALAEVAPEGDIPRFLARLHARQVAVWRSASAPWKLVRDVAASEAATLAARHATRQARDVWRHGQVARLVETTRCRRLVLLRYFGDAGPAGPCGACDVCGYRA